MKLVVNHLPHRDSPVEVREKVTFTAEQLQAIDLVNEMFHFQDKGNG